MTKGKNNKNTYFPLSDLKEKEIIYLSLIYLLEPFYVDNRGDIIRKKLRKLLTITKKEENTLVRKFEKSNLIERTGSLIFLRDKKTIKEFLDDLIKKNKINLEKITELFIN